MSTDTTAVRNDALGRATALANRARELRRAQSEVQELTAREVQVLARTAAAFFDAIPLVEFTPTLLPQSARGLRRIRHRILHRTIHNTATGMLIRALLLGRDGALRLFSARSADSRDLLLIMEPGRTLPVGVVRDVVDWTPTLRVPGFRPFEILDKLSHSLDSVEEQISEAEARVQVQRAALTSGDLSALLPAPVDVPPRAALSSGPPMITIENTAATNTRPAPVPASAPAFAATFAPSNSSTPPATKGSFDMFDIVEAVAAAAESNANGQGSESSAMPSESVASAQDVEPDEWDEPVEPPPPVNKARSMFPPMPSPR